jgi:transposase
MARSTPNLYPVELTPKQRKRLEDITRHGHAPARKIQHARVLLLSDRNRLEGHKTRSEISAILGMHVNTVDRIRRRFVLDGEAPALNRKVRATPPNPPRLDGRAEAQLVAICCSQAPEGRTRWTLRMLADELVRRRIVTSIAMETVRKTLKKTNCSLGGSSVGVSQSGTGRGSSRRWRTSSISTKRNTARKRR